MLTNKRNASESQQFYLFLYYLCRKEDYLQSVSVVVATSRVVKPDGDWDLEEGTVQVLLEVTADAEGSCGLHLLDDLVGVLVQELVHGLT